MRTPRASMRVADFCPVICGDTPVATDLRRHRGRLHPAHRRYKILGPVRGAVPRGLGLVRSGREHPHLPFRDTYIDYTRFPRVDEKLLYEDATKAYEDAVRGVTEAEERDMWRYLNSIRDDAVYCVVRHRAFPAGRPRHRRRTQWLISTQFVYGYGSPFSSTRGGPRRTSCICAAAAAPGARASHTEARAPPPLEATHHRRRVKPPFNTPTSVLRRRHGHAPEARAAAASRIPARIATSWHEGQTSQHDAQHREQVPEQIQEPTPRRRCPVTAAPTE